LDILDMPFEVPGPVRPAKDALALRILFMRGRTKMQRFLERDPPYLKIRLRLLNECRDLVPFVEFPLEKPFLGTYRPFSPANAAVIEPGYPGLALAAPG